MGRSEEFLICYELMIAVRFSVDFDSILGEFGPYAVDFGDKNMIQYG